MKFSCIVATLNSSRLLSRALGSVLSQSHGNYELIVQDGGSTDNTLDLLRRYGSRVDWRSEADAGVYDAWNKALDRATGDWALFLGSDDFLLAGDVLARSRDCLAGMPPAVDFAYGNLALGTDGRPKTRIVSSLSVIYSQFFLGVGLPFPSTFVRMETLKQHRFDPSFRIAGDLEFTLRCLNGLNVARMPHYISFMEHGGLSNNPQYAPLLREERKRVLREQIVPKAGLIAECCLRHLDEEENR
ncbi:MAG: glycosyltransferase [Desulfovibrionaceae bacterium]|nr:glycosyltransferase [Desulfovibrionaceae bacterium]